MTNNTIKVTEQELTDMRNLNQKINENTFSFGVFRIERMNLLKLVKELEDREKNAEQEYNNLQTAANALLEQLNKKYGEGSLNMTDGTFVPIPAKK
jgi:hypothetical protein